MIGVKYEFTYEIIIKLLNGMKIREYTVPSEVQFESYDDLFEILRLSFDMYPEEYDRLKNNVIEYFKENVKGNKFIIDQKIIEVIK